MLKFQMPQVTSKQFKLDVDDGNPNVPFKDSKYYRDRHHLKGLMNKKQIKQLHKDINSFGQHNRGKYDLSKNMNKRREQVKNLAFAMDNAIEAARLEQMVLQGQDGVVTAKYPTPEPSKFEVTEKGQ